jgi:hypothetical protein
VTVSGQRLGPWEILGQIAQGGQGAVLRARDPATGTRAAVKLLLRQDPKTLRRFKQEAQVLERLDHPGIVRVLGHGQESGVPWLAMQLVDGVSLRERVEDGGTLEGREAARLVAALARAVAHAHEHGVVHRDLKPENVLLECESNRPVLVDFGLLRRDAEVFGELSIDAHSRLSKTGELRGTPAYMAPEQVSPGRFGPVSPLTDVYALGGVLNFLLVGTAPRVADSLPNLIYQLLDSDEAPDPSKVRDDLPPGLAHEVKRALAREPAKRHPSAIALAEALEHIADPSRPAPARASGAGRGLALVGGSLAAVALLGGAAVALTRPAAEETAPGATVVAPPAAPVVSQAPIPPVTPPPAPALTPAQRAARRSQPLLTVAHDGVAASNRRQEARGAWVDDARFVSSGKNHGVVRLWAIEGDAAREVRQWDLRTGVHDLVVVGTTAVFALNNRTHLWSIDLDKADAEPRERLAHAESLYALAVGPDGRVAVGDGKGGVSVAPDLDGASSAVADAHRSTVRAMRFSPDGRWLATGSGRSVDDTRTDAPDNRAILWDARTLTKVADFPDSAQVLALAFSPDGRWLAYGTTGYRLFLVDLTEPTAEPAELRGEGTNQHTAGFVTPTAHGGSVRALAFLSDGLLASTSGESSGSNRENGYRVWDPVARAEVRERRRTGDAALLSLDLRPDGRQLLGDVDGRLVVWAPW